MSKFTEFYIKVNTEPAVTEEFKKIAEEHDIPLGTNISAFSSDALSALIPVAKKAGYDFTLAEVNEYLSKSDGGELSDDELEAVAGGCNKGQTIIHCDNIGSGSVNN